MKKGWTSKNLAKILAESLHQTVHQQSSFFSVKPTTLSLPSLTNCQQNWGKNAKNYEKCEQ